ncbi:MAG TPA: hypothetical protein VHM19_00185, partial [Polyangiales bacterium]|nr:hypothetical protein [Polyangiales bacterium]
MNERSRHVSTTHAVENQPLPLEDYDAFTLDTPLLEAVQREAPQAVAEVAAYGKVVGSAEFLALGMQANQHVPVLRTHDRYGHRIDEVDYHPAYHELMRVAMQHGVHNAAWREDRPGGQVAHAALLYLHTQAEAGTGCPLTMTHAAVPSLRCQPELGALFEPLIKSHEYDARPLPVAQKRSATLGMAMTEKQGGSDIRANATAAHPLGAGGPGGEHRL